MHERGADDIAVLEPVTKPKHVAERKPVTQPVDKSEHRPQREPVGFTLGVADIEPEQIAKREPVA